MNTIYCPLVCLKFEEDHSRDSKETIINSYMRIIPKEKVPVENLSRYFFSEYNINKYKYTDYWLSIDVILEDEDPELKMACFLVSLFIAIPTKVVIPLLTDFREYHNLQLYRFQYVPGYTIREVNNTNLGESIQYYNSIERRILVSKRLNLSLISTHDACLARNWALSYISFVTAFESLLNHNSEWGTKKKVAWAYALLTETVEEQRQSAFENFREIYKIRSEITHGETFKDKFNDGKLNIEEIAKCRDMLRKLWQVILISEEIIIALSGNDIMRRNYFKKIANNWLPKETKRKVEAR